MSESTKNQTETSSLVIILAGLLLFGAGYNAFVAWLEEQGVHEPFVSLLVALGTAVTVIATWPLIGWRNVRYVFAAFVASGAPMIAGSLARWVSMDRAGQKVVSNARTKTAT